MVLFSSNNKMPDTHTQEWCVVHRKILDSQLNKLTTCWQHDDCLRRHLKRKRENDTGDATLNLKYSWERRPLKYSMAYHLFSLNMHLNFIPWLRRVTRRKKREREREGEREREKRESVICPSVLRTLTQILRCCTMQDNSLFDNKLVHHFHMATIILSTYAVWQQFICILYDRHQMREPFYFYTSVHPFLACSPVPGAQRE